MTRVARRLLIRGRVQGVGFRESTRLEAEHRGVCGWVRNLSDGRVEAHAEGDPAAVDALVAFCRVGPPASRVDEVTVTDIATSGAVSFLVRRGA